LFQIQDSRRDQPDCLIGCRGSHVRELFFLHNIDVEIHRTSVLANDHSFVNLCSRRYENFTALLQIVNGIRRCSPGAVRYKRTRWPAGDVTLPFDVTVKERIHDCRSTRIRKYFASKSDEPARGYIEFQPDATGTMVDHSDHLPFPASEFFNHDA